MKSSKKRREEISKRKRGRKRGPIQFFLQSLDGDVTLEDTMCFRRILKVFRKGVWKTPVKGYF